MQCPATAGQNRAKKIMHPQQTINKNKKEKNKGIRIKDKISCQKSYLEHAWKKWIGWLNYCPG